MTNYDWIKSMSPEEMARTILNPCDHYKCEDCPLKNHDMRCIINSNYGQSDVAALEWLGSEHAGERKET